MLTSKEQLIDEINVYLGNVLVQSGDMYVDTLEGEEFELEWGVAEDETILLTAHHGDEEVKMKLKIEPV